MTNILSMVSHKNYNMSANEGSVMLWLPSSLHASLAVSLWNELQWKSVWAPYRMDMKHEVCMCSKWAKSNLKGIMCRSRSSHQLSSSDNLLPTQFRQVWAVLLLPFIAHFNLLDLCRFGEQATVSHSYALITLSHQGLNCVTAFFQW